jgi:phage shock protein A
MTRDEILQAYTKVASSAGDTHFQLNKARKQVAELEAKMKALDEAYDALEAQLKAADAAPAAAPTASEVASNDVAAAPAN